MRIPSVNILDIIMIGLACWRISNLVVSEGGPWNVFGRLRDRIGAGGEGDVYGGVDEEDKAWYVEIFECIMCCSIWVGFFYAVIYVVNPGLSVLLAVPFAISAIALMYHSVFYRLQN